MSEIISSREFVTYFTDILFGDRSYKVFICDSENDERNRRLCKDGLISDFLNPNKTKGKLTEKVAGILYERCRYHLFPEEYNDYYGGMLVKKHIPTPKEFANKFTCLFSCIFDYNLGALKLYDDDSEEIIREKKELICSLITIMLKFFINKTEADIEEPKKKFGEIYIGLRENYQKYVKCRFTQEDFSDFQKIMFEYLWEQHRCQGSTEELKVTHYMSRLEFFRKKIDGYILRCENEEDMKDVSALEVNMELSTIFLYANYFENYNECKLIVEKYIEKIDSIFMCEKTNYIITEIKNFLLKACRYFLFRSLVFETFLLNEV